MNKVLIVSKRSSVYDVHNKWPIFDLPPFPPTICKNEQQIYCLKNENLETHDKFQGPPLNPFHVDVINVWFLKLKRSEYKLERKVSS